MGVSTLANVLCVPDNNEALEQKIEQLILSAVQLAGDMDDHFLTYLLTMVLEHLAQNSHKKSN